jgi:hypothetical protein
MSKKVNKKTDLPSSKIHLQKIADNVLLPNLQAMSTTLIALPGLGKTSSLRYLLDNTDSFFSVPTTHQEWIWINLDNYNSLEVFIKDLIMNIVPDLKVNLDNDNVALANLLKEYIKEKTWEEGVSYTFILDNIKILKRDSITKGIHNLLFALYEINVTSVSFVFISENDINTIKSGSLGGLKLKMNERVFYLPLLGSDSLKIVFDKNQRWNGIQYPLSFQKKAEEISNGDPSVLRIIMNRVLGESKLIEKLQKMISYEEIYSFVGVENLNSRYMRIYNSLNKDDQKSLLKDYTVEENSILIKSGFYKDSKTSISPLFTVFVEKYLGTILVELGSDDLRLIPNLSPQQTEILNYLKENLEQVVTREEIAKFIWGDLWSVKYSDWALDKQFSIIRKFLKPQGLKLSAVRGKGVKLTSI